ncbi:OLC1v1008650C3 [Oldenlandia corymbosa var. corymbosa]|uniref:OLC1v1008650C3 n=1 Tax=Oldenlandia corymbosa var. corymbosa TaxID=529605 RepID=A0AAV1DM28_OLDCO|nr:OLC1v1008650C3 [Oldenlandia corymbosa var. corymbosa]
MASPAKSRPLDMKSSWKKGKISGWTAFDREKRHNDGGESEAETESFPSLSSSVEQIQNFLGNANGRIVLEKPFTSVLRGPVNVFASGTNQYEMKRETPQVGSSNMSGNVNNGVTDVTIAYDMLKKNHSWADQSLIEDVLAGLNYDVDEASTLLASMVSSENNSEENPLNANKELTSNNGNEFLLHESSADQHVHLSAPNCLVEDLNVDHREYQDEQVSFEKIYVHDDLNSENSRIGIKYLPIEPEWEEDDIYLVYRKDALRSMRSASQHSKAARDAYIRGDHLSAQLFSQKAREEWLLAEKLNANAAKEILAIRNFNNDEWTLDLHGLHASEAVKALQAHLQKIESRLPAKPMPPFNVMSESVYSASPELATCSDSAKLGNRISYLGPRPTSLHVITGTMAPSQLQ